MKRIVLLSLTGAAAILLLLNFSCSKKGTSSSGTGSTIGNDSILLNIGNNIILPGYKSLSMATGSLDSAIIDFSANPNGASLSNVRALFKSAYIAWESVSEYDGFGPAYNVQPTLAGLNLFPTTTTRIDSNINAGNDNVNAFSNASAKGFPALDYLLFGAGNNTLANYTTDAQASNRKQYLSAISADIKTEVNTAYAGWAARGGNYINTFVNGTGNSISSSLGLLINSMDQDFEVLKNDRLGIPLGKQPPGAILPVLPKEVEAYYSGISAQLALAQLKAVQNIYLGSGTQGNGPGLQDYLIEAGAKYNGGLLSDTVKAYFSSAVSALQAIPDPFSATIQSNAAPADALYAEIQQLVVMLKTDMPSSLGVLITYGDNDGD